MLINISKIFFILFLFYVEWFQLVFLQIPNMLLLLGAGTLVFISLHALQTKTDIIKNLTSEFYFWIFFALSSLFFGMLVAVNYGLLIRSIFTFVQFLALMYGILYISIQDDGIDFFIYAYIFLAIISAITTVFWGVDYEDGRMSMGFNNNPNSLGVMMIMGISFILYKINIKKWVNVIFSFGLIFLLFYILILTGSRKALLSFFLIITYWFLFVIYEEIKILPISTKITGILSIILVLFFGYRIFYPLMQNSVLMNRLITLLEEGGGIREEMYRIAMDIFRQHPLIGIGLDNYRAVTIFATYSHSTYAEALACTGIIGSIFYFAPYLLILFNYTKLITSVKNNTQLLKQAKVLLGLFIILLFLGTGIIHFYEVTSSMILGMIIAFYKVYKINH